MIIIAILDYELVMDAKYKNECINLKNTISVKETNPGHQQHIKHLYEQGMVPMPKGMRFLFLMLKWLRDPESQVTFTKEMQKRIQDVCRDFSPVVWSVGQRAFPTERGQVSTNTVSTWDASAQSLPSRWAPRIT